MTPSHGGWDWTGTGSQTVGWLTRPIRTHASSTIGTAHAAVATYADRHPSFYGMGTTLVMARLMSLPASRSLC